MINKFIPVLLIPALILSLSITAVSAIDDWEQEAEEAGVEVVDVYVNDSLIDLQDQPAFIDENNRTLVPLRFVTEALDGYADWVGSEDRVDVQREDIEMELHIGQNTYQRNGRTETMDTAPAITGANRTVVPLRFVSEGLGAEVDWESDENAVYIWDERTEDDTDEEEPSESDDIVEEIKNNPLPDPEDVEPLTGDSELDREIDKAYVEHEDNHEDTLFDDAYSENFHGIVNVFEDDGIEDAKRILYRRTQDEEEVEEYIEFMQEEASIVHEYFDINGQEVGLSGSSIEVRY
ncbi:copper amine oxidase N-terminal domain-containing protein [Natranaerobius thermophilus]|uniref:Copper amine oxidase domain protein n=1 Tax=Natranaerobius thermophilus (strain ATCC BAA-1301 / DSM 18059 / JW/NM-WN-LF) TaxID=457570 RepID=B2A1B4_NATTJ|nr:copper amine oxidase N-terminal domain-containing protein [Natranaerobius thermophilus]ACB86052.1 copper amine oxidase domain protein [Natranaerobius thermophilus JW/NM-WN-LF]